MSPAHDGGQLELFDVQANVSRRPRREALGRMWLQVRDDQLILGGIGGLIGLAVIFACGVERGKQLVRHERALLIREGAAEQPAPPDGNSVARSASGRAEGAPAGIVAGSSARPPAPAKTKPPSARVAAAPAKASGGAKRSTAGQAQRSRYAVQVVTYSRPQLAKQELDRLRAKGERAFLVMRDGRTAVYVGPFPSRTNASEKLALLKSRYQDCFIRSL